VQQGIRSGRFSLHKVDGEVNPADLFTKHMPTREKLSQLMRLFGCVYQEGRSAAAPATRAATGTKMTMADQLNLNDHDDERIVIHHLLGYDYMEENHPPIDVGKEADGSHDIETTDYLFDHGMTIARQVMDDAAKFGRVKVPGATKPVALVPGGDSDETPTAKVTTSTAKIATPTARVTRTAGPTSSSRTRSAVTAPRRNTAPRRTSRIRSTARAPRHTS